MLANFGYYLSCFVLVNGATCPGGLRALPEKSFKMLNTVQL